MLSTERHRQHRSLLQAPKLPNMFKHSILDTLSPESTVTTSSGYSTGGSSVSTTINPSLEKPTTSSSSSSIAHKQQQQQYKTKSKGKKKRTHVAKRNSSVLELFR
jgi:hypothetical protein